MLVRFAPSSPAAPWSLIRKSKTGLTSFSRAGELAAGILVGNLVVSPRFFTTYGPKLKSLFSSDGSSEQQSSSRFFHNIISPKTSGSREKLRDRGARLSTSSWPWNGTPLVKISETTWTIQNRTFHYENGRKGYKLFSYIFCFASFFVFLLNFRLEIVISDNSW